MTIESDQAERLLKLLADSFEQSKEFVLAEAPEVLQQLILWKRVESAAYVTLGMMLLGVLVWCCRRVGKCCMNVDPNQPPDSESAKEVAMGAMCVAVAIMCAILGPILIAENLSTAIQVWLAPKLFVLEYLMRIAG